ncbi:uncharacterized protein LOC119684706 [Teleopsis dalmanni]|uniref:uncharacterized protein LOC119684706 n=1 Tax=Teleopsis dalmanni TaxID=139649 RepID=UPI0018CF6FD7|nr:uncharacterized protein LOC119684706 [Teleopsis dalmanni]
MNTFFTEASLYQSSQRDLAVDTTRSEFVEQCQYQKLNVLYERNWTMLVHEQLRRFEGTIVAATRHSGNAVGSSGFGAGVRTTALGHFGGSLDAMEQTRWSFSEALLYSVTVITTIGHGSLTPKTAAGKIATILYALLGVPLMLMCLSSLGALLAEALQCTYARICCRLARHSIISGKHSNDSDCDGNEASGKRQKRCNATNLNERVCGGVNVKQHEHDRNGCHEQKHALDCKTCKYDAIISDPNIRKNFEYNCLEGNTSDRGEDSCQLLQNSPAKINHNTLCMQTKAPVEATIAAHNGYYYQRTMPHLYQQQQQQQQPDVMLMTTATTAAAGTSTATATQKYAYQQHYSRSATPSPQHFQHPLQTIHIVSSASANSSPTHQMLRQYATLQPQQRQHQQQHYQQQQQQHFVAVPSSMVRFQTSPNPCNVISNNSGGVASCSNMPPNCYTPAAVAVTGAATIYFPIATTPAVTLAAATSLSSSSEATATATTTTTSSTTQQISCSQPLVKYHTIQLQQHKKPYMTDVDNAGQQVALTTATLPPPPAYQTATVHGVRRAKFLTKPLPQEISTLLAESDVTYRADGSQNTLNTELSSTATMGATKTNADTTNTLSSVGTFDGSNTTVDIMEDEEESEQQRLGNCPHGTPSRVPLISPPTGKTAGNVNTNEYVNLKDMDKSTRGLINATAASFHRHTLHTFQRSGQRKSTLVNRARGCNMHAKGSTATILTHGSCYGDTTETSDDDEYMQRGSEEFVLDRIDTDGDEDDEADSTHQRDDYEQSAQVPISIVLLILICYISLGTVIFAFWENWSLVDGAYFCFVTLTTIGYGDFLPERTFQGPEVQLFACCAYLLLGLVLVAMSFSILETQLMWKCKRIAVRLKLAKD